MSSTGNALHFIQTAATSTSGFVTRVTVCQRGMEDGGIYAYDFGVNVTARYLRVVSYPCSSSPCNLTGCTSSFVAWDEVIPYTCPP